jgi:predicted neuraminidase
MSRVIALCFLLLASVLAHLHLDSRPVWAPFVVEPTAVSGEQDPAAISRKPVQSPLLNWLPDTAAPSVHAASLITLKNGHIRAFWFAGTREGALDVVINSAVYDPQNAQWSTPVLVIDRVAAEKGLSRYIKKLGNPVPARMADGRLQLFFVTVSIGGWAGSSISSMISEDDGMTWARPQRLISSPLINLSTLVKSPALHFTDGRMGLPAYHEWIGRFGEFLRVEDSRVIDKRRMSDGRSAIQPIVFTNNGEQAEAFFRQTRPHSQPKQIPVSTTTDAGQSWKMAPDLAIPNPNAAVAGLTLRNGTRLMVLNNTDSARYRLVMMMQTSSSESWQVVEVIEDDASLRDGLHREFSYPYLMSGTGDDAHLVYTWERKKIRHVYYGSDWLKQAQEKLALPKLDADSAKESS